MENSDNLESDNKEPLRTHQLFAIAKLRQDAEGASKEQLKDLLLFAYEQLFRQQNHVEGILAKHWGME